MIPEKILRFFKNKNVLVTGGTGLIGRQVVDVLLQTGADITIVSLDKIKFSGKVKQITADITDFDICKKTTRDMDFVFHLAGVKGTPLTSGTKPASHFVPTLMINTGILEACRINKVQKIVYTSSIGAYAPGDIFKENKYRIDSVPMDFAGWAKRMAELQVLAYKQQYGLDNFAIVRPANIYGPGDNFDPTNAMVIPALMLRIYKKENPVRIWGDGSAIRDFLYSKDAAEGVILALFYGTKGGFVNLGSGKECSIKKLVKTLRGFLDFNYEFDTSKPSGYPKRVMDISLARKLIGFEPSTALDEGLKLTWQWFLNNLKEHKRRINYFKE